MIDTYVFYGDSITSGENNNFKSYVDYLKTDIETILNFGVSGTTIGKYSLYPVNNYSLESLLEVENPLEAPNWNVFISYGGNDASSVALEYTKAENVLIDFVRCVDLIRQKYRNCKITFLGLTSVYPILLHLASKHRKYLETIYFKDINSELNFDNFIYKWCNVYYQISKAASKLCDNTIMLLSDNFNLSTDMDEDELHPNDVGYQKMAERLEQELSKAE